VASGIGCSRELEEKRKREIKGNGGQVMRTLERTEDSDDNSIQNESTMLPCSRQAAVKVGRG
jgi:hypothetical protein